MKKLYLGQARNATKPDKNYTILENKNEQILLKCRRSSRRTRTDIIRNEQIGEPMAVTIMLTIELILTYNREG